MLAGFGKSQYNLQVAELVNLLYWMCESDMLELGIPTEIQQMSVFADLPWCLSVPGQEY